MPTATRSSRYWTIQAAAAILIGLAVRSYAAWTLQYNTLLDAASVMLMARHMADGLAFPAIVAHNPRQTSP